MELADAPPIAGSPISVEKYIRKGRRGSISEELVEQVGALARGHEAKTRTHSIDGTSWEQLMNNESCKDFKLWYARKFRWSLRERVPATPVRLAILGDGMRKHTHMASCLAILNASSTAKVGKTMLACMLEGGVPPQVQSHCVLLLTNGLV